MAASTIGAHNFRISLEGCFLASKNSLQLPEAFTRLFFIASPSLIAAIFSLRESKFELHNPARRLMEGASLRWISKRAGDLPGS